MSIKEMIDKLSRLRDEYIALDEKQRKSHYGAELLAEMEELIAKLKEAETQVVMIHKDFWL